MGTRSWSVSPEETKPRFPDHDDLAAGYFPDRQNPQQALFLNPDGGRGILPLVVVWFFATGQFRDAQRPRDPDGIVTCETEHQRALCRTMLARIMADYPDRELPLADVQSQETVMEKPLWTGQVLSVAMGTDSRMADRRIRAKALQAFLGTFEAADSAEKRFLAYQALIGEGIGAGKPYYDLEGSLKGVAVSLRTMVTDPGVTMPDACHYADYAAVARELAGKTPVPADETQRDNRGWYRSRISQLGRQAKGICTGKILPGRRPEEEPEEPVSTLMTPSPGA
ncbi:MAG: hypothetical protein M3O22_07215 [Pseudomonadota bacterium]|nr:hypothetical protein [Pseudomonadota bacterium]